MLMLVGSWELDDARPVPRRLVARTRSWAPDVGERAPGCGDRRPQRRSFLADPTSHPRVPPTTTVDEARPPRAPRLPHARARALHRALRLHRRAHECESRSHRSRRRPGATNTVTCAGTGRYEVWFPGVGDRGSNVQVVSYGATNARCQVESWHEDRFVPSHDLVAYVRCFTVWGAPTASAFVVGFVKESSSRRSPRRAWTGRITRCGTGSTASAR
jgi:hypothetical protein